VCACSAAGWHYRKVWCPRTCKCTMKVRGCLLMLLMLHAWNKQKQHCIIITVIISFVIASNTSLAAARLLWRLKRWNPHHHRTVVVVVDYWPSCCCCCTSMWHLPLIAPGGQLIINFFLFSSSIRRYRHMLLRK